MIKKISIFILIISLILIVPASTYATIFDSVMDVDAMNDQDKTVQSDRLTEITNTVLGAIYYFGVFVSVGGLMILGIKYMAGSTQEKAEYKETMGPYILGAVLLFGGINILKLIYTIVTKIF
jgi:hypothetical protein